MSAQIELHEIAEKLSGMGYPDVDPVFRLQPGRRVRIQPYGKPASNTGATVLLFADSAGGYLRDFVNQIEEPIWPKQSSYLSPEQIEKRRQQVHEAKLKAYAELQKLHDSVARLAQDRFRAGVSGTHAYITGKSLSGLYNARIDPNTGDLMIPLWLPAVGLANVQRITAKGKKLFLKGGRVKDCYSVIGSLDGARHVMLAEGWATAAALYEMHGMPVVVAFSANNLLSVAQTLRSRFADLEITVCGDDDRQTNGNPGRTKAAEAASAVGANLIMPTLCDGCDCTDFADSANCGRRQR